jgi:hypoxanthine phosphoribosyltransferase
MKESISIMIPESEIEKRTREIGEAISRDYAGKTVHMICVLKGGVYFMTALSKRISEDVPVTLDFMSVSSYGDDTKSSGIVKIVKDLDEPLEGKDVLIVEDIIDSGRTLYYLMDIIRGRKPASVRLCTLLDKPERRVRDVHVDYTGFNIEDRFVIGCGMDYKQKYRNLPYIGEVVLSEEEQ